MKHKIKLIYSAIAFLTLTLIGCDESDEGTTDEVSTEQKRVYFNVESAVVNRSSAEPFIVELRYEGPKTDKNIEIPYTVAFPNENNAMEGEDFLLPKSGVFTIEKGKAITRVVLLQQVINNENADQNRSMSFELQATEGIEIGNSSNSGNSITVTFGLTVVIDPTDPEDFIGDKKFTFGVETSTFKIPYFSNREDVRDTDNNDITTAVIAVHGSGRNANGQFESISGAAQMENINLDTLLLIAPQFVGDEEIGQFSLDEEHLFWGGTEWRTGEDSEEQDTSSFTVMDSLMVTLSKYPNLKKIVLTGHSAGGQFTARYAASSPIADDLDALDIDVSFVVNNPGTYTYMDDKRKVLGTDNTFAIPAGFVIEDCPDYNEYRFGLENLPPYLDEVGADGIRDRLPQRKVTYLIGQNDNDTSEEATSINTRCDALLQGLDRFERATNYFDHLLDFYGPAIMDNQKIHVVPGVGHSSSGMYQSEIGRENIFRN
ncbi:hypothetical protein FVB32_00370 [Flagellimonas hymeniacidonis]|uniref:Uncharacterized protein n=1 Tax=Flagellimonas hymeniacidonis TaxID=2603628 RepID=A0A5C8V3Y6_9FLAO|nr:hypothetical protein [Flagellimonas hymeniacidonis]TXN36774.1 hypothetical protein FVB32_00370 [Flagellimonas hymeniacidonis]